MYPVYTTVENNNIGDQIYLSDINSDIVKQLQAKIEQYKANMVSAQNSQPDPNAEALIISMGFWYIL